MVLYFLLLITAQDEPFIQHCRIFRSDFTYTVVFSIALRLYVILTE